MNSQNLLVIAVGVFFATAAMAEQTPVGNTTDIRIKRFVYDENNVYKLNLYLKSVTAIQFAAGETVESIIVGDSASWEVVKLKSGNVISIKPIIDAALTNMTVYSDKRVYTFELRSLGEIKPGVVEGSDQAFRTVFTYPEPKKAKAPREKEIVDAKYLASGFAPFRPLAVRDNRHQTTFFLPPGAPRPAIFKVGGDKDERLVNSRTDGDRIIVDGTSDYWVMRIGDQTVCVAKASSVRPQNNLF